MSSLKIREISQAAIASLKFPPATRGKFHV
jgi:hypothetical protein